MNCKPGDLAIIVTSNAGNEGRIVEVIRQSHWGVGYWHVRSIGSPCMMDIGIPAMEASIQDFRLRPIRPDAEPQTIARELETA